MATWDQAELKRRKPHRAPISKTRVAQFITAGICLALVIAYCVRHASEFGIVLALTVPDLSLLLLLMACANLIAAYKVFVMLRWLGLDEISFLKWTRIFVGSRFTNFYVMQGANVYRAVKLKKIHSFSYAQSLGVTGAIACFDTASILFVTGLLVLGAGRPRSSAGFLLLGTAIVMVSPLLIIPYVVRRIGPRGTPKSGWLGWVGDRMKVLSEVLARCTQDLRTVAFISGMAVLAYLILLTGTAVCLAAFGRDVSLFEAAVLSSVLVLSRTINIVPGNLGISELITGVSAGVLMDEAMYGVMIAAIFRIIDYAVIGIAFLVLTVTAGLRTNPRSPEDS